MRLAALLSIPRRNWNIGAAYTMTHAPKFLIDAGGATSLGALRRRNGCRAAGDSSARSAANPGHPDGRLAGGVSTPV